MLYLLERFHGPVKKEKKDTSGALTCQQCITCRCCRRKETAPVETAEELEGYHKTASAEQTAGKSFDVEPKVMSLDDVTVLALYCA